MSTVPHHQPCFGRAADIARLAERIQQRGVTFVMAPPRMGKTWLVRNLAFGWARHHDWNIGYAESSSGNNDLLREVVVDLYKRWLDGANMLAQARSLWERHRDGLVGKVGGVVGKLFSKLGKFVDGDLPGVHELIDEMFDALTRAEQDLRSGGLVLTPITYEDARDLVRTVSVVTERPTLLVMDAWERGQTLAGDRGSIQKLLDNEHDWPTAFHLLVVIRDLPEHSEEVVFANKCCDTYPSAEHRTVDLLTLDDLEEQDRLLLFLREEVAATAQAKRDWVIEQCRYPAVIEWWLRRQPTDRDALVGEARNARSQQYMGLIELIERIQDREDLFATTVRLALLPEMTTAAMWRPFRELIHSTRADALVADLQSRRILDPATPDYPSFGHTTAYDAVRAYLLRPPRSASLPDVRPRVRGVLKDLIRALAGRVQAVDPESALCGVALLVTSEDTLAVGLRSAWQWPSRLARVLFGDRLTAAERGRLLADSRVLDLEFPSACALLAMALFSTLNSAKADGDLPCRDALLDELRVLARGHAEDCTVRGRFAKGLYNTLFYAEGESAPAARRDAVLDELRSLAEADPDDATVREYLAKGLYSRLFHTEGGDRLARRDALLGELRALAQSHPEDLVVRELIANALVRALFDAYAKGDLACRDVLLDELRTLTQAYSEDAAVRRQLATGLFNAMHDAKAQGDLPRRDALLDELRALYRGHPDDDGTCEELAKGLFNARNDAKAENDQPRCDALMDELRALAHAHPKHTAVREALGKGLLTTLDDVKAENDLPRRDALLGELRALAQAYPEDGEVRAKFAVGLSTMLIDAKDDGDLPRHDALLNELRALIEAYPEDERLGRFRQALDSI